MVGPRSFGTEALERRLFLSGGVHAHALEHEAHGETVELAPYKRSAPTARSVFTGQFVVTLADGAGSKATAKAHRAAHARSYVEHGNTNLWTFPKGKSAKQIQVELNADKRIADAYPVYTAPAAAPMSDASGQPMADFAETEPNDTRALATPFAISSTPNTVSASIGAGGFDVDYYSFSLAARSGVFFDIDAVEAGLSTIDSTITVYNAAGAVIGGNDEGRDWDDFILFDTATTPASSDSALYLDLAAGTYYVEVTSAGSTPMGAYQLEMSADSSYTSTVQPLNSNPGATDTVLLDFDGHAATDSWGTYTIPAYDLNGNPAEWTPLERYAIQRMFDIVAEDYAPFNINISTTYSGPFDNGVGHRQVIGNSTGSQVGYGGSLGVAYPYGYSNTKVNTAFTFASSFPAQQSESAGAPAGYLNSDRAVARAIEMGNTSSHEIAHTLGLLHYGGSNAKLNGIMHSPDFGLNRERWQTGTTSNLSGEPAAVQQDDAAVISSLTNTFGYRADDAGDTRAAATVLAASGSSYAASGIIGTVGDSDFYRFTGGGSTLFSVGVRESVGNLDAVIKLYNASGDLLASNDGTDLSAAFGFALPSPGTYYVEIKGHGTPGDMGQYQLNIAPSSTAGGTGSITGRTFRDFTLNNVYEPGTGETPLAATVFLDFNGNNVLDGTDIATTSSAVDGAYSFSGLSDGTYVVIGLAPAGYVNSMGYTVTVSGGDAHVGKDFGSFPLVYTGTGAADQFTLRVAPHDSTRYQILEASTGYVYDANFGYVARLTFNTLGGDDALTIDYTYGNPMPAANGVLYNGGDHGAAGDVLLVAGAGANDSVTLVDPALDPTGGSVGIGDGSIERATVNGGNGSDTLTIGRGLLMPVTFNGQGGTADALIYTGGAGADALTLTAGSVAAGAVTHAYATVENLVANLAGGNDAVTVDHAAGAAATTLNGGDGNDTVTVINGAQLATPVSFNGENNDDTLNISGGSPSVTLSGGAGADTLNFNGTAGDDTIAVGGSSVTAAATGVARSAAYAGIEAVLVNGLGGADTFTVSATAASAPVTLAGGDGNDAFNIGTGSLDSLLGAVTVNGGSDADTVNVNDAGFVSGEPYTVTATTVDRPFFSILNYAAAEALVLNAQGGNNDITLTGTAATTPVTINGGGGNDALTINGAASSAVTFNGGSNAADTDTLNLNAGSFTFDADAKLGTANLVLNVNASAGNGVTFNASQHVKSLAVNSGFARVAAGGSRVLVTDTLAFGATGTLDLTNNDLIVRLGNLGTWDSVNGYTGGVLGQVQSGRAGGAWNGTSGILTTQGDAAGASPLTTLGVATAQQALQIAPSATATWGGETVNGSAILVKYTYIGDADLNGRINGDDYFAIDSNVAQPNARTWALGDFDFNGKINGDDYWLIDSHVGRQILGTL
ncbi:MAG TPA: pre-peptidase C-terminal domain-containing protein [Tepidisphaeraceae bacterium]|nr:pre-peptidase C-terminal domain-containing protein [Tepidisphaeraceae bacterium]